MSGPSVTKMPSAFPTGSASLFCLAKPGKCHGLSPSIDGLDPSRICHSLAWEACEQSDTIPSFGTIQNWCDQALDGSVFRMA